jgi:Xaa-Pro dipeptidase
MVRRVAPWLKVRDIRRLKAKGRRVGYCPSISHARFLKLQEAAKGAEFIDVESDIKALRMVKTPEEQEGIRAAEKLNVEIWNGAKELFRAGMTEREMARTIKRLMIERGDGEAFETIVCVGANAAECHHRPDDTVWNGREPVLVDMGVKLGGYCSDLTRNLVPKSVRGLYRRVYALVEDANRAAIAAVKPGMTAAKLDKVARDIIRKGGFGKCFGHSLGHGVGYEIHEAPTVSAKSRTVIEPGMIFTIEPGIYLEGNLGVRIEDMVLVTEDGCEVLSGADAVSRQN